MKNLVKILFITMTILAFPACTTTKSSGPENTAAGATTSGLGQQVAFNGSNPRLQAPSDQTYHFDFDSDVVHSEDLASIQAQSGYLATHPDAKVRLAGNTDERGSREYNVALGWRRAKAVASIMQQQGVASKQIDLISFGEEKPVAFGHDEASWWQNRRDDLTYEGK